MLKVTRERFFNGANVHRPRSGILFTLEGDTADDRERLQGLVEAANAAVAPFRIEDARGEILHANDGHATIFIPLEDPAAAAACRRALVTAARRGPDTRHPDGASAPPASADLWMIAVLRAAARRGIPWYRVDTSEGFFQLGQGQHGRKVRDSQRPQAGIVSSIFPERRQYAYPFLEKHGLPVPRIVSCATAEAAAHAAREIGYPVLVARGNGASFANADTVDNPDELARAFEAARGSGKGALVLPTSTGELHRLLVIDGNIMATLPAGPLHDSHARIARLAARLLSLRVAVVELRCVDLSLPFHEAPSTLEGVSAAADLAAFVEAAPSAGIADAFLETVLPAGAPARIPTVAVTGSVGKTTTCTLVAAILAGMGLCVARTTTQGAWVDGEMIKVGDMAGGHSAQQLLLDPTVQAGVFEMAPGGLLRSGFGLDAVDVGAVLNVLDHHLGFEGIHSHEDMAPVKGLVASQARKAVVLNADDALCLGMRSRTQAPATLVSLRADNPEVLQHRRAGGVAAWFEDDVLHLYEGDREIGRLPIGDIPTTWQGRFRPGLWHALFAMAIAHGLGIPFEHTAATLRRLQEASGLG